MKYIGYHRTSTKEQHLDRGIKEISDFCEQHQYPHKKIYADQTTGENFMRPRYTVMKEDVLESGDVLIITGIDRLGRNKNDTLQELRLFKDHNIRVMILELPTTLMDFDKLNNHMAAMMVETINNMMIEMYASLAQAEYEKRIKRQNEGIAAKKARGEWADYGRPRAIDPTEFARRYQDVVDGKIKPFELKRDLQMKTSTFYQYRANFLKQKGIVKTFQYQDEKKINKV